MYSMMLAAMLTTGTTGPAWGCHVFPIFHGGHWGQGWGCHSFYNAAGCYCYGGIWGYYGSSSCNGWYSGTCSGGCWGSGYGACWGSYGCSGCYGGSYASPAMMAPVQLGGGVPASEERINPPVAKPTGKKEALASGRARILVQLPADATLFVDDRPVTLSPTRRTVVTPVLEPGQDYYYVFRAAAVRDGTPVMDSKRVVIRAGAEALVDFSRLTSATVKAAGEPSSITVRLPENARLYVDGIFIPLTANVRTFTTPRLEPGQSYYYELKAEVDEDGKPHAETRRVVVQAGKEVTVDFGALSAVSTARR